MAEEDLHFATARTPEAASFASDEKSVLALAFCRLFSSLFLLVGSLSQSKKSVGRTKLTEAQSAPNSLLCFAPTRLAYSSILSQAPSRWGRSVQPAQMGKVRRSLPFCFFFLPFRSRQQVVIRSASSVDRRGTLLSRVQLCLSGDASWYDVQTIRRTIVAAAQRLAIRTLGPRAHQSCPALVGSGQQSSLPASSSLFGTLLFFWVFLVTLLALRCRISGGTLSSLASCGRMLLVRSTSAGEAS